MDWGRVIRQAVSPVLAAYLVFLGVFIAYRRAGPRPRPVRGWPRLVGYLLTTAAAGYVFFAVIVVVFYFVLGPQPPSFIADALAEGAVFGFGVAVPSLLVLTGIEHAIHRRR